MLKETDRFYALGQPLQVAQVFAYTGANTDRVDGQAYGHG
jgi:hypothetical protein